MVSLYVTFRSLTVIPVEDGGRVCRRAHGGHDEPDGDGDGGRAEDRRAAAAAAATCLPTPSYCHGGCAAVRNNLKQM